MHLIFISNWKKFTAYVRIKIKICVLFTMFFVMFCVESFSEIEAPSSTMTSKVIIEHDKWWW
jgi:hypothetical protein